MESATSILIIILAATALLCGTVYIKSLEKRIEKLEKKVCGGKKRLPYKADDGILDATALVNEMLWNVQDNQILLETHLRRTHQILGEIRNGTYDPDQPASPKD